MASKERPRSAPPERKPRAPRRRRRGCHRLRSPRSTVRHRRVEPGRTYHVTKKTNDDLFWLVPSAIIDLILLFLLALKAKKHGVLIHEFVFLSTHFHLVLTDVEGKLPKFMGEFLSESGKALKIARRTTRRVWSGRPYSATELLDLDAAERACAYLRANPTEAELTEPAEWPGLTSARHRFGETITAKRPGIYFSKKRPESASLTLAPLSRACFAEEPVDGHAAVSGTELGAKMRGESTPTEDPSDDPSEQRIRERVEAICAEVHRRLEQEGRKLAGVDRVLRTPWTRRATHPIGDLNPRFATRDKELLENAIEAMRQFEKDHEAAKQRYIAGHHRTLFPSGTYGYRVVLGVRVAKRRRRAS